MMQVKQRSNADACLPVFGSGGGRQDQTFFWHQELNQQETEFFMLSKVSYNRD